MRRESGYTHKQRVELSTARFPYIAITSLCVWRSARGEPAARVQIGRMAQKLTEEEIRVSFDQVSFVAT